ncbi:hypothetical protein J3R74_002713 [Puniceicoccus vermicola]|uniref:LPS-assembly protein LptD n=1 Tax=Puniceicoccus vermicola TaxID=388746 RepID=A0A7X1B4C8_9BACT|nr:LPS-assembly protein LptD [Puniceicoccus vermicola]
MLGSTGSLGAEDGVSMPESPLEILSSGNLDYDFESNTITAAGPVEADYGPYRMNAGTISWDRENGIIRANGGVQLDNTGNDFDRTPKRRSGDFFEVWWPQSYTEIPFIMSANSAVLGMESRSVSAQDGVSVRFPYGRMNATSLNVAAGETRGEGTLEGQNIRAGSGSFLVDAEKVEADQDETNLTHAGVFLSDPNDWGPRVYADRIRHRSGEQYITLYGVTIGVGPVPILYLPKAWMRDWDLGISFDLGGGFSDTLGTYGEFGLSFKATDFLRLSPSVSYFGRRGWLLSPNFNWSEESESGEYYTDGSVLGGYIYDQGSSSLRGVDRFGNPIERSRGYVLAQGMANQRKGWSFVNQFEFRSDTEVLRDFRPGLENRYFAPESFSEVLVPLGPFSFSALGRFRTLDMSESLEATPSVTLDLNPAFLGDTPIVHEGWVNFSQLEREDYTGADQASASRGEAAYRLSYTLPTASWLTITPVGGVRERVYQNVQKSGDDGSSTLFELGFDLGTDFYREWPVKSEIWNINGLVHQTRPMMGYRWMPQSGMGEPDIPNIYPDVYTSGVDPLGFSNLVYRSDNGAEQVLRIGWENRFLAGDFENPSLLRDLGTFAIYQDFIESRAGAESLPDNTMFAFAADPAPWLGLELFTRVETERVTLIEFVPGLSLRDGDRWESTWYFQSLQHEVNELLWDAEVAVNRNNWLLFEMRYSGQRQTITKQAYGWRHRLGNAWLLEAKMIFRQGDTREGNFQVNFGFTSLLF